MRRREVAFLAATLVVAIGGTVFWIIKLYPEVQPLLFAHDWIDLIAGALVVGCLVAATAVVAFMLTSSVTRRQRNQENSD
jgi:hypothetical protein